MALKNGKRQVVPLKAGPVVITQRKFTGLGKAKRIRGRQRRGRS
jgi:hypothetical protein